MPHLWFAGTLVHATATLVVAFFVFFTAGRAGRSIRVIGFVLGAWLIVVAIVQLFLEPPAPPARLPQLSVPLHAPMSAR